MEVNNPYLVATQNIDVIMVDIFGSMQTLVTELGHANTNASALRREIEGAEEVTTRKKRKHGRMESEMMELMKGGATMKWQRGDGFEVNRI